MNQPEPHPAIRISPAEWRWVLWFGILVMLATTLPYLVGFASQGENWHFTGFVFGVEDGNSYIAKMRTGSAGAWLFRTPYSAAPQGGVLAFLPYLLLGKLLAPSSAHVYFVWLFHAFRLGAGMLSLFAAYAFVSEFIQSVPGRRLALVLIALGGGLGWILVLVGKSGWLGSLPLDFYSPETFGFLALYGVPHLALGRAALFWGLRAHLQIIQSESLPSPGDLGHLGVAWLLAALAQPLQAVILGYVLALHFALLMLVGLVKPELASSRGCIVWLRIAALQTLSGLPAIAFLAYTLLAFNSDPYLKAWTSQNIILSPHPLHYLLAYGWALPLALPGALHLLRQLPQKGLLLAGWVASLPLLAYLPFNLQRRLPDGIWVALVILVLVQLETFILGRGTFGQSGLPMLPALRLDEISRQSAGQDSRPRRLLRLLYLSLAFPSTLILLAGGVLAASSPGLPLFRPSAEVAASEYLAAVAAPGDVVLSPYSIGNALPAWAPVRVVVGHGPETIGLESLLPRVHAFFQEAAPALNAELLAEQAVDFIFAGPSERPFVVTAPAAQSLELIFDRAGYAIFLVHEITP